LIFVDHAPLPTAYCFLLGVVELKELKELEELEELEQEQEEQRDEEHWRSSVMRSTGGALEEHWRSTGGAGVG